MAVEPPNPYAPSPAMAEEGKAERARRPSRWLAVVATLLCLQPFSGLGLFVLGRARRFLLWGVPCVAAYALMIAAVWAVKPTLFLIAMVVVVALGLVALVDTIIAKPSATAPGFRRALVIVALVFAAERAGLYAVKHWLVEAFKIPSGSMVPSLLIGDHIMVKKQTSGVRPGGVVVYRYPPEPSVMYVKRILAVAGDRIEFRADKAWVNGAPLPCTPSPEPCPPSGERPHAAGCQVFQESAGPRSYPIMLDGAVGSDLPALTVPDRHVFVAGDNRHNSKDSRSFGPLSVKHLVGIATFVYWSQSPADELRLDRVGQRL